MLRQKLAGLACGVMLIAALPVFAQNNPPPPAGSGNGGRAAPPPPAPPATDLTGSWVPASAADTQGLTVVLKQTGAVLSGSAAPARAFPGLPPIELHGTIEGSEMDVMALFDYQGGELMHIRATFKDGHLVGQRFSVHSAPRKFRLDGTFDFDYVKKP